MRELGAAWDASFRGRTVPAAGGPALDDEDADQRRLRLARASRRSTSLATGLGVGGACALALDLESEAFGGDATPTAAAAFAAPAARRKSLSAVPTPTADAEDAPAAAGVSLPGLRGRYRTVAVALPAHTDPDAPSPTPGRRGRTSVRGILVTHGPETPMSHRGSGANTPSVADSPSGPKFGRCTSKLRWATTGDDSAVEAGGSGGGDHRSEGIVSPGHHSPGVTPFLGAYIKRCGSNGRSPRDGPLTPPAWVEVEETAPADDRLTPSWASDAPPLALGAAAAFAGAGGGGASLARRMSMASGGGGGEGMAVGMGRSRSLPLGPPSTKAAAMAADAANATDAVEAAEAGDAVGEILGGSPLARLRLGAISPALGGVAVPGTPSGSVPMTPMTPGGRHKMFITAGVRTAGVMHRNIATKDFDPTAAAVALAAAIARVEKKGEAAAKRAVLRMLHPVSWGALSRWRANVATLVRQRGQLSRVMARMRNMRLAAAFARLADALDESALVRRAALSSKLLAVVTRKQAAAILRRMRCLRLAAALNHWADVAASMASQRSGAAAGWRWAAQRARGGAAGFLGVVRSAMASLARGASWRAESITSLGSTVGLSGSPSTPSPSPFLPPLITAPLPPPPAASGAGTTHAAILAALAVAAGLLPPQATPSPMVAPPSSPSLNGGGATPPKSAMATGGVGDEESPRGVVPIAAPRSDGGRPPPTVTDSPPLQPTTPPPRPFPASPVSRPVPPAPVSPPIPVAPPPIPAFDMDTPEYEAALSASVECVSAAAEDHGSRLMLTMLSESPHLLRLFSFGGGGQGLQSLESCPGLRRHGASMLRTVCRAVALGSHLDMATESRLAGLGKRHVVRYDVPPESFVAARGVLLSTVEAVLGPTVYTAEIRAAWEATSAAVIEHMGGPACFFT